MKRAASNDTQESKIISNDQNSGKLIASVSGTVLKIRRVAASTTKNPQLVPHNNYSELPIELYKSIFEYSIIGMHDRSKLLSLLKINTVSKFFNTTINQIIGQRLRNSTADNLAALFGRMLCVGEWSIPAVFYSFAFRWMSADTCPNTKGAKNLSQICNVVSDVFEKNIITLGKSASSITKTGDGFDVQYNGKLFKFNKISNVSIHALNVFIQNYCLSMQIFKIGGVDLQPDLIDFLEKHNSKEHFSKIIGQQISFYGDQMHSGQAIYSVQFLIPFLKRGLIDQGSLTALLKRAFEVLNNRKAVSEDRMYVLRLLQQIFKMNLIRLHQHDVQFLRAFAFAEFAAPVDPMLPVQKKDAAMGMIQELIAAGYALNLNPSEMKILKGHAIERLAYQYGDLDFKHDIIEILGFVTQIEEWFSLLSVPLFEAIRNFLITGNPKFSHSVIQRLLKMYDLLLKHPEEKIRFLATEISIFIKSGAPALKDHVLAMLQDSSSPLLTRNRKLASLGAFLKSNSMRLEEAELQIVKDFVFSDLSTLSDTPNSMKKNDPAILVLHGLLVSSYSLVLTKPELEAFKSYVNEQFKDDSVDLLLKQNLIELMMHFVTESTELFSIVSSKFFEDVKNFILSDKKTYTPQVGQKLTKIYDRFLAHPNPQIALLAAEISLLIAGILPDEVQQMQII